jgi:hypothetical protein
LVRKLKKGIFLEYNPSRGAAKILLACVPNSKFMDEVIHGSTIVAPIAVHWNTAGILWRSDCR